VFSSKKKQTLYLYDLLCNSTRRSVLVIGEHYWEASRVQAWTMLMTETQLPFHKVVAVFYELPLIATSDPRKNRHVQARPSQCSFHAVCSISFQAPIKLSFSETPRAHEHNQGDGAIGNQLVSITMFSFLSRLS